MRWILGVVLAGALAVPAVVLIAGPFEVSAAARQTVDDPDDTGPGRGVLRHADTVAAAFSIDASETLALHQAGVGWGAMVKLLSLAEVRGVDVDDILASVPRVDGEYQFDFGTMRAELTDAQRAELDRMPRGLGHLMRGGHPPGLAKKQAPED